MSLETMTKLATTTVGVGGSSSVTFSNIPQGYTDLKIVANSRVAGSNQGEVVNIAFNGSSSNISARLIYADAPNVTSITSTSNVFWVPGSGATSNVFGNSEVYFSNYSSNSYKSWSTDSALENNGATYLVLIAGLWSQPAAINSITLTPPLQPFVANSTFSLYGIKNMRQTAGNSIKATGGDVIFDGTYVYHVFDSSGTFAPTQGFLADYLIIGGGGAGSPSRSGGGGAGGLLSSIEATGGGGTLQPEVSFVPITYTVIVGAGGATALDANPYSGSNSAITGFTTPLIAIGGGGGGNSGAGGGATGAALSGGSGGGGLNGPTAGGAGTANQGYRGGNGNGSLLGGCGGGGAGGQGVDIVSTNNGTAGGPGLLLASIAAATGTGVNGYYAGGGGGGYFSTGGTTGGAGGIGGGGAGSVGGAGTAGTPNTGGGGGAGRGNSGGVGDTGGSNGGSGLVIIRYKG
jgi:hypothetical protein